MKTIKKIAISAVALLLIIFLLVYREYNLKKAAEIRNQNNASTNKEEVVCVDSFKPVCGEDGKTYSNACVAEKVNSIQVAYDGECKTEVKDETSSGENIGENNLGDIVESGAISSGALAPVVDAPKPTDDYYKNLRSQCAEDSCCLSSVDTMEQKGYGEATDDKCPAGYDVDLLKCEGSYKWCALSDKPAIVAPTNTGSTVVGGLNYFNTNFNYGFILPSRTYFSGYGAQGGANHTVGISSSSGAVSFGDNAVKVYFYKGKILPELQNANGGMYQDKSSGKTYLDLNGNSVVIESAAGNDAIVQSIIKSIYVK